MRDIFKAEWLRYRPWVLIYAAGHVLVLAFFSRLTDLGQQQLNVYRVFAVAYVVSGLVLGLHQMGTWRRPNQWINLLHRPLPPMRIALGMLAAGTLALLVAVLVPIVLILASQALGTARVVETRHVALAAAGFQTGACGYLAGAYGALANRRYAAAGLVLVAWVALAQAAGVAALLVQGLACAWLFTMVSIAFRPDLGEPPLTAAATVVTALTVQAGIYLLIVLLGFVGELGWIMQGTHPANMVSPPYGGHVETDRMPGRERMLAGLASASLPQVPLWREQIGLSDVHALDRQLRVVPRRGDMGIPMPAYFDDVETRVRWTFSHDRMRFEGAGLADGRPMGELGIGANDEAFDAVASPGGLLPGMDKDDVTIVAGNTLYQYRAAVQRIVPRIRLPRGEWIAGVSIVGGSIAVLANSAVYIVDGRHLGDGDGLVQPRYRIPLPGAMGDLSRAELIELVDGYLVSFAFTWHAYDMRGAAPYQAEVWVNDEGQVTPVAVRVLHQDFPAFYRYRNWWTSPAMHALCATATGLFAVPDPLEANATPPVPEGMRVLALALALVSLTIGGWLSWRRMSSIPSRVAWTLACGAIGVPALLSLVLLVPHRQSPECDTASALTAT